ncbi:MAG: hypothetical protein LBV79_09800 [Candidatus Adiutrix sp.]|jgi:hypothetical protein|nr:hypothetical protein [Candidatus Adiutrix sp.]
MYKEFDEFLDQQHTKYGLPTIDFEQRKEEWLTALNALYAKIQAILQPYLADQRVYFLQSNSYITEKLLGRYPAPQATIVFGGVENSQVTLDPIGTFIIKGRGRVDMIGPTGKTVKFVLVKKNDVVRNFKIETISPDKEGETEWVWKMASPPPDLSYLEFTESNFLEALMFVMDR